MPPNKVGPGNEAIVTQHVGPIRTWGQLDGNCGVSDSPNESMTQPSRNQSRRRESWIPRSALLFYHTNFRKINGTNFSAMRLLSL